MNLYLLIDASPSILINSLWDKLLGGISDFVDDPAHVGIGVGFGYYGTSCDPTDYAAPRVPVGALPGVAAAIKAAFPAPVNGKASAAALTGSMRYARSVATAEPERDTAVVFMSDGLTDLLCGSATGDVAESAGAGLVGQPPVKTYVVALGPGPTLLDPLNVIDLTPLDDVARAGGTTSATRILVSLAARAEIAAGLHRAVLRATPCSYRVPEDVARSRLKLEWSGASGAGAEVWPIVERAADCTGAPAGFWPTASSGYVELCPAACDAVRGDPDGSMGLLDECADGG